MRFSLSLTALLIGVLALAPYADAQRRASGEATHSVALLFDEADAAITSVKIEVKPNRERARAPWGGDIKQMALGTNKGHIILIDEFLSSGHSTGYQASTFIPTGETVQFILIRGENTLGWKVEEDWPSIREQEWSVIEYQDGEDVVARPQANRMQGEETANNALCNGILDPWTGECIEEIKDPFGVRASDGYMKIEMEI